MTPDHTLICCDIASSCRCQRRLGCIDHAGRATALEDAVRAVVRGKPIEWWPKHVADAISDGLFGEGAWQVMNRLREERAAKPPEPEPPMPPKTRRNRWEERPEIPTRRFVRATSLDPVLDWAIGDGACRCLLLVISLAGGVGKPLVTLSSSIARQLGRSTRTVQNHWKVLEACGYITRAFDRNTGLVTITTTEAAAALTAKREEPPGPPVKAPDRPAKPAMRWPRPPRVPVRVIHRGGAKMPAHINACATSSLRVAVESAEQKWLPKGEAAPQGS